MTPSTQIGMDLSQMISASRLPSQPSLSTVSTDRDSTGREAGELLAHSAQPERQLAQMVFKGQTLPLENLTCPSDAALITPERLATMQRLIKRIAQLQSQQEISDEPFKDPTRSPEALLPQVLLEVQAVLKQSSVNESGWPAIPSSVVGNQSIYAIYPLSSRLLWQVAQSAHEVMRLLEGMAAQVSGVEAGGQSGARDGRQDTRQSGILRLVAQAEVQTAQFHHALDLVTFQTPLPALPETAQVQIPASLLGQQSVSVAALLQRLTAQFRTDPLLNQLITGLQAEILMPQQSWQPGRVGLDFRLLFTPTTPTEFSPAESSWSAAGVGLDQSGLAQPGDSEPLPVVQFTQPSWLEQHITTVVEDQLTQVLHPSRGVIATISDPSTDPALAIVQQAVDAIDALQRSLTMASRTLAPQSLPLDELALRLQWNLTRTAYGVMQFLSGIPVHLLQPQHNWRAGSLRWGVYLAVQAPQQSWRFDLVRRALVDVNATSPGWESLAGTEATTEATIVQFSDPPSSFLLEPFQALSLADLEAKLWYPISKVAPELLLLRSETEVKVTTGYATTGYSAASTVQMGVVQLKTSFEFRAD